MEELFNNFSVHIEKMISPKLGNQLKTYLDNKLNAQTSPEDYNYIENDIKNIMTNYFQNASDKEFLEIATNLFNCYVENDDENLIKSVKFFIRIYTYFQNINLKKKLYQWKINAIYKKINSNSNNNNSSNIRHSNLTKSNSGTRIIPKNYLNNNYVLDRQYNNKQNK